MILNSNITEEEIADQVESIDGLDNSSRVLFSLFNKIETYLDTKVTNDRLTFWADYIVNKVMLFEIGVPGEQDAHRVFVTMNDRGLKLGPIDLLKGYLLSNIIDNEANTESHKSWMETTNSLKKLSHEEDSQFIKTWLRALFANSIRGKNRGDAPGDFEVIGDSYHRWVVDNKAVLGLHTTDDFQSLISETIPKYAKIYLKIKHAEDNYIESMQCVYYNGVRNLTLQSMLILATICKSDSDSTVTKKIKLVSTFLDIFATSRILNNQDNTYDNVRDPMFALTQQIRWKSFDELRALLKNELDKYLTHINLIINATYKSIKRQDLLHLIARIGAYLEDICNQTNSVGFSTYVDRNRASKTFDIEHILCDVLEKNKHELSSCNKWDFESDAEYNAHRDLIGSLILLPRGRNRSLRDKTYSEKMQVYSTENILCQSLHTAFLQNNPTAKNALEEFSIELKPYAEFNKQAILERTELYRKITSLIWNKEQLDKI